MKTAKLIKDVRSEMGLTQKEFAELLGTSRENIANYETRVVAPGDVNSRCCSGRCHTPCIGTV
jgi:DNA-binding transcriptional regulator YiaG